MGTRRKLPLTIYLDPDDPLVPYFARFKDRSAEAVRLMRGGTATPTVTVTQSPMIPDSDSTVTVTEMPSPPGSRLPADPVTRDNVTPTRPDDLDPGWD